MAQSWSLYPTRTTQNKFHQDSRKRTDGMDKARSWNSETRRSDAPMWEPWILRAINVLSTGHVLAMQSASQATALGFLLWILKAFISVALIICTQKLRKWAFHGPAKFPPTDLLVCQSWKMKRSSESVGSFSESFCTLALLWLCFTSKTQLAYFFCFISSHSSCLYHYL